MHLRNHPSKNRANWRIIIYPKDIELITGKANRSAVRILDKIRKETGKKKNQLITITEFCIYTGIKEELVREYISS